VHSKTARSNQAEGNVYSQQQPVSVPANQQPSESTQTHQGWRSARTRPQVKPHNVQSFFSIEEAFAASATFSPPTTLKEAELSVEWPEWK
jgi:hypothetical protein